MIKNDSVKKENEKVQNNGKMIPWIICVLFITVLLIGCGVLFHKKSNISSTMPKTIGRTIDQKKIKKKENEWYLILVNRWNYIPDDYEVELTELDNGQSVDKRIYSPLQNMFNAAREDDVYLIVASGYRTAQKQQSLMDEKITEYKSEGYSEKEAKKKAEEWVAIPGTSEHQLGIGIDINADGIHSTGNEVYKWLHQNSYKYGFICRYPEDKTDITGIINEPWHYRYVGVDVAEEIYNQGECLEEYIDRLNKKEEYYE